MFLADSKILIGNIEKRNINNKVDRIPAIFLKGFALAIVSVPRGIARDTHSVGDPDEARSLILGTKTIPSIFLLTWEW